MADKIRKVLFSLKVAMIFFLSLPYILLSEQETVPKYTVHRLNLQYAPTVDRQPDALLIELL